MRPVVVFFFPCLLIHGSFLKIGDPGQLSCRGVCRAMLYRGVSIAKVAEVVHVCRAEEDSRSERVNRCIPPLEAVSYAGYFRID